MADRLPISGPYRHVDVVGGGKAPFFVVPFDKDGVCTGPVTRQRLVEAVSAGGFTDVFLFSHGWNNTWPDAIEHYERFVAGFARTRARHPLARLEFRPLLVGIFWPSTALVERDERAPAIAGDGTDEAVDDDVVAEERREVEAVAEALPVEQRSRFYELAQRRRVQEGEAAELAGLLASLWAEDGHTDDLGARERLPAEELLDIWERLGQARSGTDDEFGFAAGGFGFTEDAGAPELASPGPAPAGLLNGLRRLDPRDLVRGTTVWLMKDRAGRVGSRGVHELLADVVKEGDAHVHLVGHSYGGKVVLSALCAGSLRRPVESVLLLQPAMSYLCFAPQVPGRDGPGGYRAALDTRRCRQPVLATFSTQDVPLTRAFHLFVRRRSDLGEAVIAGEPPSRYAALGGFGPLRVAGESDVVQAADPGVPYPRDRTERVLGVESSGVIGGHSDVSNDWTWWMLLDQVAREG